MAVVDSSTIIPGVGHIWLGTVGTAVKPTVAQLNTFASAGTVPSSWTDLGHTSLSDVLAFGQDGGDTTVKGSWQNASLREITTSAVVDYFVIKSLQILDNTVLSLYYGGGDASVADNFALPDNPAPTEKAVTVVMLDGSTPVAFYAPRASIRREDAPDITNDDFMDLPLRFTILKASGSPKGIWIADALGLTP